MDQYFFLSLFAVSATLLGICVAILGFTHSSLLNPNIQEGDIKLGDVDYKNILEKTIIIVTGAGISFGVNTIGIFCLFLYANFVNYNWSDPESILPAWCTIAPSIIFIFGCCLVLYTLVVGKVKLHFLKFDKKPPEIE